jgi:hypothetical protein
MVVDKHVKIELEKRNVHDRCKERKYAGRKKKNKAGQRRPRTGAVSMETSRGVAPRGAPDIQRLRHLH